MMSNAKARHRRRYRKENAAPQPLSYEQKLALRGIVPFGDYHVTAVTAQILADICAVAARRGDGDIVNIDPDGRAW